MKIALDYDGTYTLDSKFWQSFIDLAKSNGHEVWIVTMRYPTEPIDIHEKIVYTSRRAKKSQCERRGYYFDIWIDDSPEWLFVNGE